MLSTIMDAIVIIVLVVAFLKGVQKGFLGHIIGILALIIGIWGGNYIAKKYSPEFAQTYFMPWISEKVDDAIASTDFSADDISSLTDGAVTELNTLLTDVVTNIDLPLFSFKNVDVSIITNLLLKSTEYMLDMGEAIQSATVTVLSEKLAHFVLFLIAFFIIQTIAFYTFSLVNTIFKLPIIGSINRLAGGLLGLLFSSLLLTTIFWLVSIILPPSTAPGGALSPEVMEQTYVAHYMVDASKSLFSSLGF